jgi:nicotinamide mononucleotide (NMN) deamidase PncC
VGARVWGWAFAECRRSLSTVSRCSAGFLEKRLAREKGSGKKFAWWFVEFEYIRDKYKSNIVYLK